MFLEDGQAVVGVGITTLSTGWGDHTQALPHYTPSSEDLRLFQEQLVWSWSACQRNVPVGSNWTSNILISSFIKNKNKKDFHGYFIKHQQHVQIIVAHYNQLRKYAASSSNWYPSIMWTFELLTQMCTFCYNVAKPNKKETASLTTLLVRYVTAQ